MWRTTTLTVDDQHGVYVSATAIISRGHKWRIRDVLRVAVIPSPGYHESASSWMLVVSSSLLTTSGLLTGLLFEHWLDPLALTLASFGGFQALLAMMKRRQVAHHPLDVVIDTVDESSVVCHHIDRAQADGLLHVIEDAMGVDGMR